MLAREPRAARRRRPAPLRRAGAPCHAAAGAGGLQTLRFDAVYERRGAGSQLDFADRNYASRIGWREIVVTRARRRGASRRARRPPTSASDELRAYPKDLLRSPLDVRTATARFTLGERRRRPRPTIGAAAGAGHRGGGFEALIQRGDLSLGVDPPLAADRGLLGRRARAHARARQGARGRLSRRHEGQPRHAVLLGATVTVTHTAGVFALGLVTLAALAVHRPRDALPLADAGLGAARRRRRRLGAARAAAQRGSTARPRHHHHHHATTATTTTTAATHHYHHHDHATSAHDRGILGVGVAAGLLPCPSALVVLLSAIALHRIGFGLR